MSTPAQCACGSGLQPQALHDGHGIFMCFACSACRAAKVAEFRPDIFEPYQADEPIEDDE